MDNVVEMYQRPFSVSGRNHRHTVGCQLGRDSHVLAAGVLYLPDGDHVDDLVRLETLDGA